ARRLDLAHRELRVVGLHGADAGEDRAGARPPVMAVAPGFGAGDPLRAAIFQGGAPIERRGDLEAHPGPAPRHARHEADIELARLVLQQSVLERDSSRAQALGAAGRLRIGIAHGGNHALYLFLYQQFHARRRAPRVVARLQRHVDGRALRIDVLQRAHFGVRTAGFLVPALADHRVAARDDATDPGTRRGGVETLR